MAFHHFKVVIIDLGGNNVLLALCAVEVILLRYMGIEYFLHQGWNLRPSLRIYIGRIGSHHRFLLMELERNDQFKLVGVRVVGKMVKMAHYA